MGASFEPYALTGGPTGSTARAGLGVALPLVPVADGEAMPNPKMRTKRMSRIGHGRRPFRKFFASDECEQRFNVSLPSRSLRKRRYCSAKQTPVVHALMRGVRIRQIAHKPVGTMRRGGYGFAGRGLNPVVARHLPRSFQASCKYQPKLFKYNRIQTHRKLDNVTLNV
jgi:hypothetical protein